MSDTVPALLLVLITLILPPVGVALVAGCGVDLLVNICLTLLGYIPGHIHAFYIEYVYYDRRDRARHGQLTGVPAPGVYSDRTSPALRAPTSTLADESPQTHNASASPAKKRKLTFAEQEVGKAEKLAAKEEKARLRAEEKARKEEEKRLRDEEKRRKAEEKDVERAKRESQRAEKDAEKAEKRRAKEAERVRKLAENVKKEKSQTRIGAFFGRPAPASTPPSTPGDDLTRISSRRSSVGSIDVPPPVLDNKPSSNQSDFSKWILPFFPHDHTVLAPHNRFLASGAAASVWLDLSTQYPNTMSQPLSQHFARRRKKDTHAVPVKTLVNLIRVDAQNSVHTCDEASLMLSKTPYKILQFCEDVRPPYQGTYSRQVSPHSARRLSRKPVLRALPDTDYDYDSEADTGLCWEGETNLDGLSLDITAYRLDLLHYGAELPINPFSDDHWSVTGKDMPVEGMSTSMTQHSAMQPPRIPLATVNLPNGTVSRGVSSFHTGTTQKETKEPQVQKSKVKRFDKPVKMISDNLLPAFKAAVAGNDLNKVALVEILKKKFPTCSKDSIKGTLESVASSLHRTLVQLRQFSGSAALLESLPVRIYGRGTGTTQTIDVEGELYKIQTDTYQVLGGNETAPSPVSYSLASLGSCAQVTGSVVARDHYIKLGEWDVAVEGWLPTAVFVEGKQGNPNWEKVVLKVRVQTNIKGGNDDPKFKHYVSEAERRCPIVQLFIRSGIEFN
ncbi:hypothetical protein DV736_g1914, partial [Chaetothyriales sp. CBS 134916]